MKKWIALLLVALLGTAGLAQAQCFDDPNEICVFWEYDCGNCINCMTFNGGPISAYVVLMNASEASGVLGFEFQLVNADGSHFMPPDSDSITGYTLPSGSINASAAPEFAVGSAFPIPWSPCIMLIAIDMLIFDPSPWCFGVAPLDTHPSIPGHMAYAAGNNPGNLIVMNPCTGPEAPDYGMACLNSSQCPPPIATDKATWDGLKSLYR